MNHLEAIIKQFYEWRGYIVRTNVRVGNLPHGGWAGELDIAAYHPRTRHLLHLEPSLDAHPWEKREVRFAKKFETGRQYIRDEVFPWLEPTIPLEQIAILVSAARRSIAGATVVSVDEFVARIRDEIKKEGAMARHAIPEQFDLLRTIQMTICGYYRIL